MFGVKVRAGWGGWSWALWVVLRVSCFVGGGGGDGVDPEEGRGGLESGIGG